MCTRKVTVSGLVKVYYVTMGSPCPNAWLAAHGDMAFHEWSTHYNCEVCFRQLWTKKEDPIHSTATTMEVSWSHMHRINEMQRKGEKNDARLVITENPSLPKINEFLIYLYSSM